MTQPESRTVEELAMILHVVRNHVADPRAHEIPHRHPVPGYREEARAILAAAKEHGLVIGEGELDVAATDLIAWFDRPETPSLGAEGNRLMIVLGAALAERLRR